MTNATSHRHAELLTLTIGLAAETHPQELRNALATVFDLSQVERSARKAHAVALETMHKVEKIAARVRLLCDEVEKRVSRMERQAEWLERRIAESVTRAGVASRAANGERCAPQPAEAGVGPAAPAAQRVGPTGTRGTGQAGAVPAGQGVPATAGRAEIVQLPRGGKQPDRTTDVADCTAGPEPSSGPGARGKDSGKGKGSGVGTNS